MSSWVLALESSFLRRFILFSNAAISSAFLATVAFRTSTASSMV